MELTRVLVLLTLMFGLVCAKLAAEGGACRTHPSSVPGRCLTLRHCTRMLRHQRISTHDILGHGSCHRRRVCCPSLATQPTSKETVCGEQMNAFTPSILGGRAALTGEWPWLVSLSTGSGHECGGALVSANHVITAAHCVIDNGGKVLPASRFTARAGILDLRSKNEGQTLTVSQVTIPPDFDLSVFRADVAVMKLKKPAVPSRVVGFLCLPNKKLVEPLEGKFGAIAGWGDKREDGNGSNILQSLSSLPIWNHTSCLEAYKQSLVIGKGLFCAGYQQGRRDSCQGDSGGPLMLFDSGTQRFSLGGIVSTGLGCGRRGFPGVYTNVLTHLSWIQQQLK